MPVSRISENALRKLVKEPIDEKSTCVIKFYSNGCEYCHNLQDYYEEISDAYKEENIHFFAFNVEDATDLDSLIKINGVPSIAAVSTGEIRSRIRILEDPDPPNKHTWYFSKDIKSFIDREK